MKRLPLILSSAALAIALLGVTPFGQAARVELAKVVPFATKAGFAAKAGTANNALALGGHKPSAFPLLGKNGKLPANLVATNPSPVVGSAGAAGPAGPAGPAGATGPQGAQGASGVVAAYTKSAGGGSFQVLSGAPTEVVSLPLPAGRYVLFAEVQIAQGTSGSVYFASCQLSAGSDTDSAQAAAPTGGAAFSRSRSRRFINSPRREQRLLLATTRRS